MTCKTPLLILFLLPGLITVAQNRERILTKSSTPQKPPSEAAMNYFNKGADLAGNKDYAGAIRNYERAIAIDSDYVDAYNNLGLSFYESAAYDSAAYYLEISLRKLPTGTTALQNIALVEERKEHLPKALAYYKQIIALEPENPEGYYNTARVLTTMSRLDESVAPVQQAEKLYAKAKSPQIGDCYLLELIIFYNLHNKPLYQKYKALCNKENVPIPPELANYPN